MEQLKNIALYRRIFLLTILLLALPASLATFLAGSPFGSPEPFDASLMLGMTAAAMLCALWALLWPKRSHYVGHALVSLLGAGISIRFLSACLPNPPGSADWSLLPVYLGWLPLFFVVSFVLLRTWHALYASIAVYALSTAILVAKVLPDLAWGTVEPWVSALFYQFIFAHAVAIAMLAIIPALKDRYQASLRELATLKALHQSEARFRDVFEHSLIGMARVRTNGDWLDINEALCAMVGYSRQELKEKSCLDIVHPEDYANATRLLSDIAIRRQGGCKGRIRLTHYSGSLRWVAYSASVVLDGDGGVDYCVFQIEDVTTSHLAAAELRRSNRELEEFAYVISHDLREPLRGIGGFAQLLTKLDELSERGREYVDYINQGVQRADELTQDLLEYSRAGNSKSVAICDAREVLTSVLNTFKGQLEPSSELTVDLQIHSFPVAENDLQRLLQNIISNAIKFRRPHIPLKISVGTRTNETGIELVVDDNGVGIPPGAHERVFEMFKRLHGREVEGTGMGLTLCRKIVNKYGGDIWASTNTSDGTTIHVSIPRSAAASAVTDSTLGSVPLEAIAAH